ncbi:MAG: hypothetical protein P8Y99_15800 [Calditrichaceae bacterium]
MQDTAQEIRDNYYNNPEDTATTVWRFKADMVHDFAWTADPDYVLMQSEWNDITLNVLAMSADAEGWRQVTDWGLKALKFYYETYGPYPYKQFTVADTYIRAGGIEYPNIVMINTGISPELNLNRFKVVVVPVVLKLNVWRLYSAKKTIIPITVMIGLAVPSGLKIMIEETMH